MSKEDPSIDLFGRMIAEIGRKPVNNADVLTAITAVAAFQCLYMNNNDVKLTKSFIKKGIAKSTIGAIPAVLALISLADQVQSSMATKQ